MTFDDELSAAARALHREWESAEMWPAIAEEIAAIEQAGRRAAARRRAWRTLAAAAVILLAVAASILVVRERLFSGSGPTPSATADAGARLLSDEALSEVERAEEQYIAAIELLATKAAAEAGTPASPLVANLRERLLVIDAAIANCRAEIDRNRFNAHLRRQLLSIYQEKRRTLEQILQQEPNAS